MATYIGVDGGGTKTRLLIQHDNEEPRYVEFDQTIRFLENGYDEAAARFFALLNEAGDIDIGDIKSISIGLAGASLETEQRRFEQSIKALLPGLAAVHVQGDSSLSLGAAFPDATGIIVISGTGSVVIGRTDDNAIVRVGGWGRLLGDEGSGHSIGLAALRHYARAIDGRDTIGPLFKSISEALAESLQVDARELRTAITRNEIEPSQFAKFLFDVTDDPVAEEILSDAADALAELIRTCASLLHYRGEVKAVGSVIQNPIMMQRVQGLIDASGLKLSSLEADSPVKYALQLARTA
jgi:N-acetylglucosamine kinase-like BadF-type ATPase